jgi:hypothetical protein
MRFGNIGKQTAFFNTDMSITKHKFLILIFIFFSNFSFSQDYLKYNSFLHSSHKYDNHLSDFERKRLSLQLLDSAFYSVNGNGFINDYISGIWLAIKINDLEKAADYYLEALKKGATKYYIKNELNVSKKEYHFFQKTTSCKKMNKLYREKKQEWKINKDKSLCRKIRQIIYRDQIPRLFKPNYIKMAKNDSINVSKLKQIYYEIGHLPAVNEVGKMYSLLLQPSFLHFPPEDVCFFANILLEMYLKGEYDELDFIFEMLDQASVRYGAIFAYESNKFIIKETDIKLGYHKQSFGFNDFTTRGEDGYWYKYVVPVYDREYADSIRKYFGYNTFKELSETNKYYIYNEDVFIEKWGDFIKRDFK